MNGETKLEKKNKKGEINRKYSKFSLALAPWAPTLSSFPGGNQSLSQEQLFLSVPDFHRASLSPAPAGEHTWGPCRGIPRCFSVSLLPVSLQKSLYWNKADSLLSSPQLGSSQTLLVLEQRSLPCLPWKTNSFPSLWPTQLSLAPGFKMQVQPLTFLVWITRAPQDNSGLV